VHSGWLRALAGWLFAGLKYYGVALACRIWSSGAK